MIEIQPELLERCRKGDKRAETELYKLMYGFLMSICRRYQYQEEKARELVNLGYYRILTNLPKYQAIAPFRYWAARVMVNVVINEHKKEKLHYGSHAYTENYSDDAAFSSINEAVDKHNIERIVAYIFCGVKLNMYYRPWSVQASAVLTEHIVRIKPLY